MSDTLKAQAMSLASGIEATQSLIAAKRGELEVLEADLANMRRELGSIERYFAAEGISLPYSDRKGE